MPTVTVELKIDGQSLEKPLTYKASAEITVEFVEKCLVEEHGGCICLAITRIADNLTFGPGMVLPAGEYQCNCGFAPLGNLFVTPSIHVSSF